jgi:lipooligosaccharide transport system permease protein
MKLFGLSLSGRFIAVFRRNFLVWKKLAVPSMIGNMAEPLITLMAFGYGLGALIGQVDTHGVTGGVPYILFLASGAICMSTMNAATFEALYSAFSRMHMQRTWDGIMNAPVTLDDIVLAECLWAAFKSLLTATAILFVILVLGISREWTLLALLPLCALVGVTFSAVALIFNALAKGYDFFTYYFTLILTPMVFISGVYFPLAQLPVAMQWVAKSLPLYHSVELIRPLFLGMWPTQALLHIAVLVVYAVLGYLIAMRLTRKRFFG